MSGETALRSEHEEIRILVPAYAIGATDPEDTHRVEAHLARCAQCRALLAEYTLLADDLLYTIPPATAPDTLEDRLRAHLDQGGTPASARIPPSRSLFLFPSWGRWATAAALLLLLIANFYWLARLQHVDRQLSAQATALAVLAQAPTVSLRGDAPAPQARGTLHLSPDSRVALLTVTHLPPLPQGKAYQVWLIHNGKRDSGGLFRVRQGGETVVLITAPRPLREYRAIGITVEPAGGSPGPTGPRVIGGRF